MNNLKKQLQAKSSPGTNQEESQKNKQSQGLDATASTGKNVNKTKDSHEQKGEVKKLSYVPGVVLRFHCQNLGTTKKELRVGIVFRFVWRDSVVLLTLASWYVVRTNHRLSVELLHFKILSVGLNVGCPALYNIKNSTTRKYCSVAFI